MASLIFMCNNPQKEEDFKKKIQKIEKLELHMFATLISLIGCHFFLVGIDSWLRLRSCSTILPYGFYQWMPIGKMIIQIVDRETKDLHEMGGDPILIYPLVI